MLLTSKALTEGSRLLALHAAMQIDILERSTDADEKKAAEELLSFLIPIVKGMLTEWSIECTYNSLQCFGGHGYVREWGMEQLARDARITTIYEGTTQIQALDLLGRKIMQLQGVGMRQFLGMIQKFCEANATNAEMIEFILPLAEVTKQWGELTMAVGRKATGNADEMGAAAVDYLFYSGYVALGLLVGARRGGRRCQRPSGGIQGSETGHRALLFRPDPAAYPRPRGGHAQRCGEPAGHARRGLR